MDTFDRISYLLERRAMSQADLARLTGISTGLISQWKKRTQRPSAKKLAIVAESLGVSVDYLLTGEEDKKEKPATKTVRASDEDIKFALFNGDKEITDEMYEEVKAFAAFVKQREQKKKDEESS